MKRFSKGKNYLINLGQKIEILTIIELCYINNVNTKLIKRLIKKKEFKTNKNIFFLNLLILALLIFRLFFCFVNKKLNKIL